MISEAVVGKDLGSVTFPVDKSKLAELARSFHDSDPVWFDLDAARSSGFGEVPTPPTVTVLADHWRADGALAAAIAIGADLKRVLHGEASWTYHAPIRLGDEITAHSVVGAVTRREGKRGGPMTMVTIDHDFTSADGTLLATRRDTLIETEISA